MTASRIVVAAGLAAACAGAGCGRGADDTPTLTAQAPAAAATAAADGTVPHGDHNPHHGGLVLMNGDLHFEVVANPTGFYQLYFSDAMRNELPAATASEVTFALTRPGQPPEAIALHIDDSGESWVGHGRPVEDAKTTARIAYTSHGKPYFIDVPFPR